MHVSYFLSLTGSQVRLQTSKVLPLKTSEVMGDEAMVLVKLLPC